MARGRCALAMTAIVASCALAPPAAEARLPGVGVYPGAGAGPNMGASVVVLGGVPFRSGGVVYHSRFGFTSYSFVPYPYGWRSWRYGSGRAYWPGPTQTGAPLHEVVRRIDPALYYRDGRTDHPPPREPDRAMLALRAGDFERAGELFRSRSERARRDGEPFARDLRMAGFAFAAAGRFDDAARVIARAYRAEPTLFADPIEGVALLGGPTRSRRLGNDAVAHARRAPSPDAWLCAAVLLQADGRFDRARELAPLLGDAPFAPGG